MDIIYNYLDYRSFLHDFYESRKKLDTFFSYRYMAFKLNMDHSLLVKILSGKRHIADSAVKNFTKFCKLKNREALYFETLVNFEKAKTKEQSRIYFEKLLALKDYRSSTIPKEFYKYFQKWYYVAIRSLLDVYKFRGNYRSLAQKLNPSITTSEAKEAIALLEKLKYIEKDSSGVYRVTDSHISTPDSWQDIAISAYQKETIKMSSQSIDRDPKDIRDISSITMSITEECFEDIKGIIKEFRTAIIKRVDLIPDEQKTDRLYQLNIQLIPLSKIIKNY